MANDLTGDFDVVVEFALSAANRVLAAMHANERFLHSVSLRVDDNQSPGAKVPRPSIGGTQDLFGDPVVNHKHIGLAGLPPGQLTASNPLLSVLNPVVNIGSAGIFEPPVVPSHLQGRAQLQLSPPVIDVPDASGTNVRARIEIMSRYIPDPQTSPAAEFVRGELQITAPVNLFSSNAARVVEIDIRSNSVFTNFSPIWTSRPLSPEDLAGINLLIRNALKTSFLPTNAPLPNRVTDLQIKTLAGSPNAIAILLNMVPLSPSAPSGSGTPPGHPGTVHNVFVAARDDFAFAVGRDFVQAAFPNVTDHRFPTISGYTFSVTGPTVQFEDGQLLLIGSGHAHNPSEWYPDFNFTVKQALILNLVATTPGGPLDSAIVVPLGDISLEINGVPDFIVNLFAGSALDSLRQKRDSSLNAINQSVRDAFDADKNLGQFLRSLLNPAVNTRIRDHRRATIQLAYTSVEIRTSGIVLHGSLTVPDWSAADVEFVEIPVNTAGGLVGAGGVIFGGPDYSALKTWIPGGLIQRYEWAYQGQTPPFVDENRFVLVRTPVGVSTSIASRATAPGFIPPGVATTGVVSGFAALCLTVRGTRISSSGLGVMQPVSATTCAYGSFPVISGLPGAIQENSPLIALAHPGPQGQVIVTGHAAAQANGTVGSAPNLIVHFADEKTASHLELLTQALLDSKRKDAATAVLAVLTPAQLSKARHVQDVIYADDVGAWERLYKITSTRRPLTLIISPKGNIVWQHEGSLDVPTLAAALRQFLTPGRAVGLNIQRLGLRTGATPPDFLFEFAPGQELTLSKLKERPAILVFWKSISKPSLEAVRDVQKAGEKTQGTGTVVLAVNDGESPEIAQKAAAEHKFSAILVTDPKRAIARAYGVSLWPTIVFLDADGVVRQLRYGRVSPQPSASQAGENPTRQDK
jgi:peroxiredoxin